MGKYYGFVTGLPSLSLEISKISYTQQEYYIDLLDELSNKDRELLDWLRLEQANKELVELLEQGDITPLATEEEDIVFDADTSLSDENEEQTLLPVAELKRCAYLASQGRPERRSDLLPSYMLRFLNSIFEPQGDQASKYAHLSYEDRLSAYYYAAAGRVRNNFLAQWFRFNQTLRNVLTIYTCRRLGWEACDYIVGDSEIEEKLLASKAKDFDLTEEEPLIGAMVQIAEEANIAKRERLIDALRWNWLEAHTFDMFFDIEVVLAYYIRLGIVERWTKLDKEVGQEVFRNIVMGLKAESNSSLDAFRKSTNKN